MSTPRRSASIWRPIGAPPYTVVTRSYNGRPSGAISSATCRASSRVGTSTRPRGALRGPAGRAVGRQPGQHRQPETERLAGPGLGAAEDVAAGESIRQRARLDRERLVDAAAGQDGHQRLRQSELAEAARSGLGKQERLIEGTLEGGSVGRPGARAALTTRVAGAGCGSGARAWPIGHADCWAWKGNSKYRGGRVRVLKPVGKRRATGATCDLAGGSPAGGTAVLPSMSASLPCGPLGQPYDAGAVWAGDRHRRVMGRPGGRPDCHRHGA